CATIREGNARFIIMPDSTMKEPVPSGPRSAATEPEPDEKVEKEKAVTSRQSPIDRRPFRSKAELEREQALEQQYRKLGNDEVVAAIRQMKSGQTNSGTAQFE